MTLGAYIIFLLIVGCCISLNCALLLKKHRGCNGYRESVIYYPHSLKQSRFSSDAPTELRFYRRPSHNKDFRLRDSLYLSLDRSLIPRIPTSLRLLGLAFISILVIVKKTGSESLLDEEDDNGNSSEQPEEKKTTVGSSEPLALAKKISSFLTSFAAKIVEKYKSIFKEKEEEEKEEEEDLDINDWNICSLASTEQLGEDYCKVRFNLKSSPSSFFSLDLGQEVPFYTSRLSHLFSSSLLIIYCL